MQKRSFWATCGNLSKAHPSSGKLYNFDLKILMIYHWVWRCKALEENAYRLWGLSNKSLRAQEIDLWSNFSQIIPLIDAIYFHTAHITRGLDEQCLSTQCLKINKKCFIKRNTYRVETKYHSYIQKLDRIVKMRLFH